MSKPLFTTKHYKAIAEVFRQWSIQILPLSYVSHTRAKNDMIEYASRLIKLFKADNPKFNEDKFWKSIL